MAELFADVDNKMVIASRANGFATSYGHLDLVIGESAPKDVYPLVAEWLDRASSSPRVDSSARENGASPDAGPVGSGS